MIQCAMSNLYVDTVGSIFAEGSGIIGSPPGAAAPAQIPAAQGWELVRDPLGSSHYLIVNTESSLCIGIGANDAEGADITDDSTDRGVALTLQAQEPINNNYQLWDFVPPTGGTGTTAFIQNPQTGYVIELQSHSIYVESSNLVVNSRQISNPTYQLWTTVDETGAPVALPLVVMAQLGAPLQGNSSYVFLPPNQGDHLVGITVTLDISEDVIVGGFSLQINCNTPYLGPDGYDTEDYDRDAQWAQFSLFMQNNQLTLFTQSWHRLGPVPASEFPSVTEFSAPIMSLQNNTIPAGTRIIMNICTDQDDFAIGIAGIALDSTGLPIGDAVYWPALGRDSFHTQIDGGKTHQKAMAPVGAFQVVMVGLPGGIAQFQQGMGVLTITASPAISAQSYSLNPFGIETGENSNMLYDFVPSGSSRLIAQPFGISTPLVIPQHLPSGLGTGLQRGVIILGDGGVTEVLPGDAEGPPYVLGGIIGGNSSSSETGTRP
jgi:hypothetical protein